jgi:nucleoside-triphosphatase THEP1
MDKQMLPYDIISIVLANAELVCGEKEEGKAPHFYLVPKNIAQTVTDIRAIWNTRAPDPLMEEMARALEFIKRNIETDYMMFNDEVGEWCDSPSPLIQMLHKEAEQALQKYRERKNDTMPQV